MVNWQDPATVLSQTEAFVLLQHVLAGIYLWEVFECHTYDWMLIREQRRFAWPSLVYMTCRLSGVAALVTILTGLNVNSEINCQAWLVSVYCFAYLTIYLSTMLIAIHIIAIWNRNKTLVFAIVLIMLGLFGLFVRGAVIARSEWEPVSGSCLILKSEDNLPNTAIGLGVNLLLLLIMLVGLLRRREASKYGLWRMLWHQDFIWIFLATIAEVPAVVFLSLNLNTPMNLMFFTPGMIILLIGSTRMYRSLTNFFSPESSTIPVTSGKSDSHLRRRPTRTRDVESNGITMLPLEVSVHRVQENDADYISKDMLSPASEYEVARDYKGRAI